MLDEQKIGQDVNGHRRRLKHHCSKIDQNKQMKQGGGRAGTGETKRDKEWKMSEKRQSRSHHQTNTRAGFPFLTDGNGKEEGKNKGSSGNKELIKNSKKVKLPD